MGRASSIQGSIIREAAYGSKSVPGVPKRFVERRPLPKFIAINTTGEALKAGYTVEITGYDPTTNLFTIQKPSSDGIGQVAICTTPAGIGRRVAMTTEEVVRVIVDVPVDSEEEPITPAPGSSFGPQGGSFHMAQGYSGFTLLAAEPVPAMDAPATVYAYVRSSGGAGKDFFRHVIAPGIGEELFLKLVDFAIDTVVAEGVCYSVSDLDGSYDAGIFPNALYKPALDGMYQLGLKTAILDGALTGHELILTPCTDPVWSDGWPIQRTDFIDPEEGGGEDEGSRWFTFPIGFVKADGAAMTSKNTYKIAPMAVSFDRPDPAIDPGGLPAGAKGDILMNVGPSGEDDGWVALPASTEDYAKPLEFDFNTGLPVWRTGTFVFILRDGSVNIISQADVMAGFDPADFAAVELQQWSLEFDVTEGAFDPIESGNPEGVPDTTPFNGDAFAASPTEQSYYRLTIIRNGNQIGFGGVYRENRFCTATGLKTEFVRVG